MPTGNPNNVLYQFSMAGQGAGSGFGQGAYERALAAGLSPQQIKSQMASSGLTPGPWVSEQLAKVSTAAPQAANYYQQGYSQASGSYGGQGVSDTVQEYIKQLRASSQTSSGSSSSSSSDSSSATSTVSPYLQQASEYQKKIAELEKTKIQSQIDLDAANRERNKYKSDYEQLKDLGNRQRDMREDDALARLRSGSTVSGSNASRGSLQGGSPVAAGSAGGGGRTATAYGGSSGESGRGAIDQGRGSFGVARKDREATGGSKGLTSGYGLPSRYAIA